MGNVFIGVDVGTGSARAGAFDATGRLLASARHPIRIWQEDGGIVEQSSRDIWTAVVRTVREVVAEAEIDPASVSGLGFDATCSLVVLAADGGSLPVGPSEDPERDVVVWMDHRALDQTRRINAMGHPVLRYVGGAISPEMQTPKLLWLKENRPEVFRRAGHFFDLSDFLSWRATGSPARSACTVTCKWTYLAHEKRWDGGFFESVGLGEFPREEFRRIGAEVVDIGAPQGNGLTDHAAQELGLRAGTPVGAPLIDAHAGAVGTVGGTRPDGTPSDPTRDMAFIMGTSACAMAVTSGPAFVAGVWGPYRDAMLPGLWLNEGGQSAFGAALDYLIALHPAYESVKQAAAAEGCSVLDILEARAIARAGGLEEAAYLAREIQVVPEFLGNRSPEADPAATAAISGLTLDAGENGLLRLFVSALCGLCYGTRQIVMALEAAGVAIETIVVSGGAARSPLLRRILADATGLRVALPETKEPVLLGAAMLGAVASGAFVSLPEAARHCCRISEEIEAQRGAMRDFHDAKFEAYEILQQAERATRARLSDTRFASPGR